MQKPLLEIIDTTGEPNILNDMNIDTSEKTAKHTKGVWNVKTIYKNPFSIDTLYIINSGTAQSLKESEANAKLIAASPKMLVRLRELLNQYSHLFDSEDLYLTKEVINEATN